MKVELEQNALSIHIRIVEDQIEATYRNDEITFVYKRWDWTKDATPLFPDFVIEPAQARICTFSYDHRGQVSSFLRANIHNAIGAFLAYQLDEMFKTKEDFKRSVKVVQYGPVFYVEWAEEEGEVA